MSCEGNVVKSTLLSPCVRENEGGRERGLRIPCEQNLKKIIALHDNIKHYVQGQLWISIDFSGQRSKTLHGS